MKIEKIYIDVSDTMALPPKGKKVFESHEMELMRIVSKDPSVFKNTNQKEFFIKDVKRGYEKFLEIRRNNKISIEERYRTWIEPFTGFLNKKHIDHLVEDWQINTNFINGIELIDRSLKEYIDMEIVSGNLVNINKRFLEKKELLNMIKEIRPANINFSIQGIELLFDRNGTFQGEIKRNGELFYADYTCFPGNCIVVGDDAMEKYGFKDLFINVQNFDEQKCRDIMQIILKSQNDKETR